MYLPEEAHREEYIMNESGIIWAGAHSDMFTWPWNFAQVSSTCPDRFNSLYIPRPCSTMEPL